MPDAVSLPSTDATIARLRNLGVDLSAREAMVRLYRTATHAVTSLEATTLRSLGLSHSGFVVLVSLWLSGPQEPRHLAKFQGVAVPSITSLLNTLERQGLVARKRSTTDKRLVDVTVTDAGAALAEKAQLRVNEQEKRFASGLSAAELSELARLLSRFDDAVRKGSADRT